MSQRDSGPQQEGARVDRRRRRAVFTSVTVAVVLVAAVAASAIAVGSLRAQTAPAATTTPEPTDTPTPTAAPAPDPSSAPTAGPSPAPSASPAPPAVVDSDPATWLVTEDGMGPFEVGMPFATALSALAHAQGCRGEAADPAYLGFDNHLWIRRLTGGDSAPLTSVTWLRYDVDAADFGHGPRTAAGIGLGSSIDDVRAAYPSAVSVSHNGEFLQAGRIYFDVTRGQVNGIGVTSGEIPWEFCG